MDDLFIFQSLPQRMKYTRCHQDPHTRVRDNSGGPLLLRVSLLLVGAAMIPTPPLGGVGVIFVLWGLFGPIRHTFPYRGPCPKCGTEVTMKPYHEHRTCPGCREIVNRRGSLYSTRLH